MSRPTKERLDEIKKMLVYPFSPIGNELLAEIDALEAEIESYGWSRAEEINDWIKKGRAEGLAEADEAIKKANQLRVEWAIKYDSLTVERDQLLKEIDHLFDENLKLKERVAKLREALTGYMNRIPANRLISEESAAFEKEYGYGRFAREALASDDEMASALHSSPCPPQLQKPVPTQSETVRPDTGL